MASYMQPQRQNYPQNNQPQAQPQNGQPAYNQPQVHPQNSKPVYNHPQAQPQNGQPVYNQPQVHPQNSKPVYNHPQAQPQNGQPVYNQPQARPQNSQPAYNQPQVRPQNGQPQQMPGNRSSANVYANTASNINNGKTYTNTGSTANNSGKAMSGKSDCCPLCGFKIDKNALFCVNCGSKLSKPAESSGSRIVTTMSNVQRKPLSDDEITAVRKNLKMAGDL